METKLVRIAEISATSKHPIFTSVYHLINEDMLKQCHKELDGNKAVGIDRVTKDEYGKNLDRNIKELVQRLKNKSFKSLPSLRVYIPNPDKPEKLFLFSTPCVILKKKGVFICYSLINTLIKFMASLPVMTA